MPRVRNLYNLVTPLYASQWKIIGIMLDLPLCILESIEYDYRRCQDCCDHMLEEWCQRDINATWQKVFDVIDSPIISKLRKQLCLFTLLYDQKFDIK